MADAILQAEIRGTDMAAVTEMMAELGKASGPVIYRSINKSLTGVRTDATAAVYAKLNLTKTRIRKDFGNPIKATAGKLRGEIKCTGKPIGLISFGAKQLASGAVSVKVLRTGAKKRIRHAFIATAKGAANVWWREEIYRHPIKPRLSYAKLPQEYRFPIQRLTGPRIQDILAKPVVLQAVLQQGWARLDKEMARLLQLELDRYRGTR